MAGPVPRAPKAESTTIPEGGADVGEAGGGHASRACEVLDVRARRMLAERAAVSALLAAASLALPAGAPLAAAVFWIGTASGAVAAAAYRWLGPRRGRLLAWGSLALDLAAASAFVWATGGATSPVFGLYLLAFSTPLALKEPWATVATGPAAAAAFLVAARLHEAAPPAGPVLVRLAILAAATVAAVRVQVERRALVREHDRRVAELAAINSVAHELTSILEPDALMWRVVGLVRERFGHAQARIGVREGDRLVIRTAGAASLESVPLSVPTLLAEAARTGTAAFREGGAEPARIAVPLLAGGRPIGALEVEAAPGGTIGARDIRSLEAVAAFTAVTLENAGLHQSALRSALTDPLTGLFNVRYLQETLAAALARAEAAGRPFSLLMLDVDNLRDVNNRCGHLTGDLALREVARVIASATRDGDIAARYGGDEFLLALPDAGAEAAAAVAERVRREVEAIRLVHRDEAVRLTVSIGVASHPQDGRTLEALVEAADRAAYRAKSRGRNRIVLLTPADVARSLAEPHLTEGWEPAEPI